MFSIQFEEISPGVWVGLVVLDGVEIWRSASFDDHYAAENAARQRLVSKLSGLLNS